MTKNNSEGRKDPSGKLSPAGGMPANKTWKEVIVTYTDGRIGQYRWAKVMHNLREVVAKAYPEGPVKYIIPFEALREIYITGD